MTEFSSEHEILAAREAALAPNRVPGCLALSAERQVSGRSALTLPARLRTLFMTLVTVIGCQNVPDAPVPPTVFSISVTPSADTLLTLGDTARLRAVALDQDGNTFADRAFTWSTADETIVTVTQDGLVRAVGPHGSVVISASADDVLGLATIEVVIGPAGGTVSAANGRVTLMFPPGAVASPFQMTVEENTSAPSDPGLVQSTAFTFGPDGTTFDKKVELSLQYDGGALPSGIDERDLRVHRLENGNWTEFDGAFDGTNRRVSAPITGFSVYAVLRKRVAVVEITGSADTVLTGETVSLTAEPLGADGKTLAGATVIWSSDDPSVASVDSNGLVTGVSRGSATITASSESGSGSVSVTVLDAVGSVVVTPMAPTVFELWSQQLAAEVRDPSGNPLPGRAVTWASGDDAVATVDLDGFVTGVAAGSVTITASAGGVSGTADIDVQAAPVSSVTVTPVDVTLQEDETAQIAVELRDAHDNVLGGRTVTWDSDDDNVARVDQSGLVTAFLGGTTNIIAESQGQIATTSVTVVRPPPTPIACGALLPGHIKAPGDFDEYEFDGQANDLLSLTIVETPQFGASDARVTVSGPGAAPVTFDSNSQAEVALSQTGTWNIKVNTNNGVGTGFYSLGFECLRPPVAHQAALSSNELYLGSVTAAGQADVLTFTSQATVQSPELVVINLLETAGFGGATSARITLFDPSGFVIRNDVDSDSRLGVGLSNPGAYVLRINASDLVDTGTYNLSFLSVIPAGTPNGTIACGGQGQFTGKINVPGELAMVTFDYTGATPAPVQLELEETVGFGVLQGVEATVYDPSGRKVLTIESDASQSITLRETGRYAIWLGATDFDLGAQGEYALSLTC